MEQSKDNLCFWLPRTNVNQLHEGSQQNHNDEPNKNTQHDNQIGISCLALINQQD